MFHNNNIINNISTSVSHISGLSPASSATIVEVSDKNNLFYKFAYQFSFLHLPLYSYHLSIQLLLCYINSYIHIHCCHHINHNYIINTYTTHHHIPHNIIANKIYCIPCFFFSASYCCLHHLLLMIGHLDYLTHNIKWTVHFNIWELEELTINQHAWHALLCSYIKSYLQCGLLHNWLRIFSCPSTILLLLHFLRTCSLF
ncbi:hypothetical protein FRX31_019347 [Thalictrum thalictroides]|uniref:Uncharacterized protein n=1 Tax=Thalictrum thalictroides TaxID=46969 RepID=A0A7J6W103_THATH|nr:hypothetical protein FRX31_019347 [Thalictrum thalictroides]